MVRGKLTSANKTIKIQKIIHEFCVSIQMRTSLVECLKAYRNKMIIIRKLMGSSTFRMGYLVRYFCSRMQELLSSFEVSRDEGLKGFGDLGDLAGLPSGDNIGSSISFPLSNILLD